jgi:hypothetical protein
MTSSTGKRVGTRPHPTSVDTAVLPHRHACTRTRHLTYPISRSGVLAGEKPQGQHYDFFTPRDMRGECEYSLLKGSSLRLLELRAATALKVEAFPHLGQRPFKKTFPLLPTRTSCEVKKIKCHPAAESA